MTPRTRTIDGSENVRSYLFKRLERKRRILKKHRKRLPRVLTALVCALNSPIRRRLAYDDGTLMWYDTRIVNLYRLLLAILDEMLEHGVTRVIGLSMKKRVDWTKVIPDYYDLGRSRLAYETATMAGTSHLIVSPSNISSDVGEIFRDAVVSWYSEFQSDGEWQSWYYETSGATKTKIRNWLDAELKQSAGIGLDDIARFETIMKWRIKKHLFDVLKEHSVSAERGIVPTLTLSTPLLHFSKDWLLQKMVGGLTTQEKESWLDLLVYKPGLDINRSPLLKLQSKEGDIYSPLLPVFQPLQSFFQAWIVHTVRTHPRSRAQGAMSHDYGNLFEKYIRKKLSSHGLQVLRIRREFHPHEYADMAESIGQLGKTHIEVDVVSVLGERVFVISCKTMDLLLGPEMARNKLFIRYSQVEKRSDKQLGYAHEIDDYSKCLANSDSFRKQHGLVGKKFIPVLVTSTPEPLCNAKMRAFVSSTKRLPSVVITCSSRIAEDLSD